MRMKLCWKCFMNQTGQYTPSPICGYNGRKRRRVGVAELTVTLRKKKRISKNSSQYVIRDYIHLPEENIESCKKYIHSKYGISESNFQVEYLKEFPLNDNGKIAYAELLKYVNEKFA